MIRNFQNFSGISIYQHVYIPDTVLFRMHPPYGRWKGSRWT